MDGIKHVLGIWVQAEEGASFWAHVCAELANRGVKDVLIVCCDGLTGLPEAIEATWPQATVQTCVVHLIRASMRFVSYGDRRKVAAALKAVYTAPNQEAAWQALTDFSESDMGVKHPSDGDDLPAGLGAIHPFFLDSPADAQARHLSPTSWEVPPPPTVSRLRATSCARITDEPRPLPLSMRR